MLKMVKTIHENENYLCKGVQSYITSKIFSFIEVNEKCHVGKTGGFNSLTRA